MKIGEAMHKGVDWCEPDTPIFEIARIMRDDDVGAVPIGENDKLVGMVTDRDIVCRGLAQGSSPAVLTARDVMTKGILYCTEDQELEEAAALMEKHRIRRLPVINADKRMTGMFSLGDLSHAASPELTSEFATAVSDHH